MVQAPPSLLSFAARISLEFYSLPHVTHRVKLHLRRVTHQHSASPSRPGHRQQQPLPTEEPQPGSQPAPPSAECAAATHGNSRSPPGAAREAPPPRRWRKLPKVFGFFRELRTGWSGKAGGGGWRPAPEERSKLSLWAGGDFERQRRRFGGSGVCVCGQMGRGGIPRGGGDLLETPAGSDPAAEADRPGTLTRHEGPEPRGLRWKVADAGHRPGESTENYLHGAELLLCWEESYGTRDMWDSAPLCGQPEPLSSLGSWRNDRLCCCQHLKFQDSHPTCPRHPVLAFLSPFCSGGMLLQRSFHLLRPGT